jgi:hypothetical protein
MNDPQRNMVGPHSAPVVPAVDVPLGNFHLLAIGIDLYAHWGRLQTAARGATALAELLGRDYGFTHITRLLNAEATRARIVDELYRLAETLTPDDSLLIYFAGHGHLDKISGGAWIPVEGQVIAGTNARTAAASWIENHTVKTLLRSCPARHILLVSDSCFAGDFLRVSRQAPPVITDAYVRTAFAASSRHALTSGALEPVSDGGLGEHSVFTGFLLQALEQHRDPWLLPSQLHERVRVPVAGSAAQQPVFGHLHDAGGAPEGEFVLFRTGHASLEQALARRRDRLSALEQAEADAQRAREEQQRELAAREAEAAELDRQIAALQQRLGGPVALAGSNTLDELVTLIEQREREAAEMEALRRQAKEDRKRREAEIARLRAEELARRQDAFRADWAKYQRVAGSPLATPELRRAAWRALCANWQVAEPGEPGELEWHGEGVRRVEKTPPAPKAPAAPAVIPATKAQPFTNSLGMKFVPVVTSVDGQESVLFSVWATRVRDYAAFAAAEAGVDAAWKNPGFAQGDTHPVVNVSSEDAGKFCAWLTAKERGEGKIGQAQTYRLPTDSEWSWAVGIGEAEERAGKGRSPQEKDAKIGAGSHPWAYPWGQDWPPPKGAGNYGQSLQVDDYEHTSPVGSFGANPQGLYDLGGNVWEWMADYYDGKTGTRSLRGGSWIDGDPRYLLSSSRSLYGAGSRYSYCGFRLVLVGAAVC